jgi:hypothetical protein
MRVRAGVGVRVHAGVRAGVRVRPGVNALHFMRESARFH